MTLQYDIPPHEGVKTTSTSKAEKKQQFERNVQQTGSPVRQHRFRKPVTLAKKRTKP